MAGVAGSGCGPKLATASERLARFESNVLVLPSGCWEWQAGLGAGKYGRFWAQGKAVPAHRFAYESWVGPIPDGLTLDHTCHDRSTCSGGTCAHRKCINPLHLEPVTSSENVKRRYGVDRCKWGHDLTPENCYLRSDGTRRCKTCANNYNQKQSALRREERTKC